MNPSYGNPRGLSFGPTGPKYPGMPGAYPSAPVVASNRVASAAPSPVPAYTPTASAVVGPPPPVPVSVAAPRPVQGGVAPNASALPGYATMAAVRPAGTIPSSGVMRVSQQAPIPIETATGDGGGGGGGMAVVDDDDPNGGGGGKRSLARRAAKWGLVGLIAAAIGYAAWRLYKRWR